MGQNVGAIVGGERFNVRERNVFVVVVIIFFIVVFLVPVEVIVFAVTLAVV